MRRTDFSQMVIRSAALTVTLLAGYRGSARADAVDDYVKRRMAREHIPGLSLVVVRDGRIVKAKGYGRASLELGVAATPRTVYDLASTTKPFTAAAVLLLVQDGKLSLEDRIGKFLEGVPESWQGITLRHLLSHTSGIKDYLADLRRDFPNETPPEQIARAAMEAPLNFAPGTKWAYSNTGYVLLGMAVNPVRLPAPLLDAATGYYNAYGSQLLRAVRDGRGLLLNDGGGVNNEFVPVSVTEFVAEEADRAFTVRRSPKGEVIGATLRLGPDPLPVQRIGPLPRGMTPRPDPDPARTGRVGGVLRAFSQGGQAVEEVEGLAPQARKDYSRGPSPELAGFGGVTYAGEVDVSGKGIERHGAAVGRVLYYRLKGQAKRWVLVYLTAEGLVTDQDVVSD